MEPQFDINWFAVHTKRFREAVAASNVGGLGLEVFLPMVKVECLDQLAIKVGTKPLFPGYFFARFNPAVSLESIESMQGVLYVIKSGLWPVPVDEHVVREIQSRVEADGLIRLLDRDLRPGDRVSIQEGSFAGMMGRVEAESDDRRRVMILMETLWQAHMLLEKRLVGLETV
jgi:transcriptional antiterminator RfaH